MKNTKFEDAPSVAGELSGSTAASDADIKSDVEAHIQHGSAVTSDIIVEVRHGVVTLIGEVPHRLMKQQLEDAAASRPGVRSVQNKLSILLTAPWPEANTPRPD